VEGSDNKTEEEKETHILASDSITHFKTVASFGNDQILLEEFAAINSRRAQKTNRSSCCYAVSLGLSVAIQNLVFAVFYYATAALNAEFGWYGPCQYDKMYIAMFVFIFGAFTAAQSTAMGPDVGKAKLAAKKIFTIMGTPSKIDVLAAEVSSKQPVKAETFRGKIEFRDVWFRYPARLN